jgi:putative glutamine amidotransferase
MPPRIAIPMPHSFDREYAERAIPQYERAVQLAGGEPVRIPLDQTPREVMEIIEHCDAVVLPGSKADVDPAKFRSERSPHTASADEPRNSIDDLLLEDAYHKRKPILAICYGLQSLNVFRGGSLIQHIPDFLAEDLRARVNHEAGSKVAVAHAVELDSESKLAEILRQPSPSLVSSNKAAAIESGEYRRGEDRANEDRENEDRANEDRADKDREGHGFSRANSHAQRNRALAPEVKKLVVPVNSSHHQSAETIGEGLRLIARCPDDGIIEALEGTAPDHFVIAVQWHPERSVDHDEPSRAIFRAFVKAATSAPA